MNSNPHRTPKGVRYGGRQKGTPNQLPDLRAMTIKALIEAGGVDYLARQAVENPGPFLGLLGRVMPREVHTELTAEVRVRQEVRRDLVEKLCVLISTGAAIPIEHETPPPPLPAIAHTPDSMLRAQALDGRDQLSRRAENARREGLSAVAGAVQRAASMHLERSSAQPETSETDRETGGKEAERPASTCAPTHGPGIDRAIAPPGA